MLKNSFARAVVLIAIALVLAIVTNGFASRTRRLVLPGYYPNALRVPPKEPERVPPPARTETAVEPTATAPTTATIAPSPAPGQPPIAVPTATIEEPAAEPAKPAPKPVPTIDIAKFQPHPNLASVDVSGEEATALHKAGALFLDARRTS